VNSRATAVSEDGTAVVSMPMTVLPNGVAIDHVERGEPSGLPIVFLHGVTDSWRSFERVLPLVPPSMRAYAYSQRGHGNSSRPPAGYRFADFSEDLRLFLDAHDIDGAVIVGHSMGSYVAQRFALDHPDRTRGLVLMGGFTTLRHNAGVRELWDVAVSTLKDPVDPNFVRAFQESTLARPVPADFLDTVVRESLKVPARIWRATFADFLEADFSAHLRRISAPTLIVWGDRDTLCSRGEQEALRERIRGAELIVYAGAGHGFHWEDPAQFASDLQSWCSDLIATRGRSGSSSGTPARDASRRASTSA
jgi:non-heme chloroperoxidase